MYTCSFGKIVWTPLSNNNSDYLNSEILCLLYRIKLNYLLKIQ